MSYIGNSPITSAFLTDTFSGNGSTTAFTMTVAPATTSSVIVAITGVLQDPSTYSVSGTTLTFSAAPPTGTSNISVRYLGIPASGVTTTAYRTVTNFTATAGQTSFSTPSYTVGYINVFRNGVYLPTTDYTATTGTTVVLNNGCTVNDTVTVESFYVSSVLNALANTGGTLSGQLTINSATGQKPLIAQVNGTEVFEIDASGNLGIGGVPSYKLDVQGTSSGGNVVERIVNFGTAAGTASILQLATGASSERYVNFNVNYSNQYLQTAGSNITTSYTDFDTQWFRNNSGTVRAIIDSSGNLGIGTSSPTNLSGYTTLQLNNATNGGMLRVTNGTQTYWNYVNSGGAYLGTATADALIIQTNNAERMRIDSSGNLLVGTTSVVGGSKTSIVPSTGQAGLSVQQSGSGDYCYKSYAFNNSGTYYHFYFVAGATFVGQITSSATTTTYATTSDYRLKEEVQPLTGALAVVSQLKPVKYKWKLNGSNGQGFIAHELQSVVPDAVVGEKDAVNEDGSIKPQSIDTSFLVATLTAAIQEQQALITQLQADVAALKGNK